ncbi:MAG: hypothetical protein NC417_14880 [Candidatus Gastranaerophilales bacterium]|nr:hypothetical protein [Candidatus Gastranaerophilales bacterium]
MDNWKKQRNYKRIRDERGNIIANIITIGGEDISVTEEVFLAYSQPERRERYIAERRQRDNILSLEQLQEDHVPLSALGVAASPSAEDTVLANADMQTKSDWISRLTEALSKLDAPERDLIQALFFDGISAREYARQLNVRLNTIQHRRDQLIKKLRRVISS